MVAVGGHRPVDTGAFYTSHGNYEATLLDVRTRMLDAQNLRTRQSYISEVLNYGNIEQEMRAERTINVTTPKSDGTYSLQQDTPLFVHTKFASNTRMTGLTANVSSSTVINYATNLSDARAQPYVGQVIEINGEERTIASFTLPTPTAVGTLTLTEPLTQAPPIGSMILFKGNDFVNPHLTEIYRISDKYGSYILDENRYQVDKGTGIVRYRPTQGAAGNWPLTNVLTGYNAGGDPILGNRTINFSDGIWYPDAVLHEPYYFGKAIPVKQPPPPADTNVNTPAPGAEHLGAIDDPVASGSNGPAAEPGLGTGLSTSFGLPYPDGEYSNIRITAPPGVSFEVELNGAKLAVAHNGGSVLIPFFDPNYQNDQQKANELIDPDIYIQRFVKSGNNHLVIKATQTSAADDASIVVEGFFNGVNLATGAVANNLADPHNITNIKPHAASSVRTLDWSTSRHSVLGIAGKINFRLGDQIALEDANDEVQKAQGVLESLSTIIAGTDINQFQSLLSVIR